MPRDYILCLYIAENGGIVTRWRGVGRWWTDLAFAASDILPVPSSSLPSSPPHHSPFVVVAFTFPTIPPPLTLLFVRIAERACGMRVIRGRLGVLCTDAWTCFAYRGWWEATGVAGLAVCMPFPIPRWN
jgi:hypothetical protein